MPYILFWIKKGKVMLSTSDEFFYQPFEAQKISGKHENQDKIQPWKDNTDISLNLLSYASPIQNTKKTLVIRTKKPNKNILKERILQQMKSLDLNEDCEKQQRRQPEQNPLNRSFGKCIKLERTPSKLPPIIRSEYEQVFKGAIPMIYETIKTGYQKRKQKRPSLKQKCHTTKNYLQKAHPNRYLSDVRNQQKQYISKSIDLSSWQTEQAKFPNVESLLRKNSNLKTNYNIYESCVKKSLNPLKEKKARDFEKYY